jgi:hypothetical protein
MESAATRIAVAIQAAAANVDLEVLSLPGGSVFAMVLWLRATVVTGVGRTAMATRLFETLPRACLAAICGGMVCGLWFQVLAGHDWCGLTQTHGDCSVTTRRD